MDSSNKTDPKVEGDKRRARAREISKAISELNDEIPDNFQHEWQRKKKLTQLECLKLVKCYIQDLKIKSAGGSCEALSTKSPSASSFCSSTAAASSSTQQLSMSLPSNNSGFLTEMKPMTAYYNESLANSPFDYSLCNQNNYYSQYQINQLEHYGFSNDCEQNQNL